MEAPLNEIKHPIKETKLAKTFLDNRYEKLDGGKRGLDLGEDYRHTFKKTLGDVVSFAKNKGWKDEVFAGLDDEQINVKAEEFLDAFREIEIEDTLYKEIPEALPGIFQRINGVSLWSKGHESYQPVKIDKSGIKTLLEQEAGVQRKKGRDFFLELKSFEDKEAEIPNILRRFREQFPAEGQNPPIRIVFYDDTLENFEKAEKYIKEFEELDGVEVRKVFVFAKTGAHAEEKAINEKEAKTRKKFPDLKTADSISDLAGFLPEERGIPTLLLLDFDGALSDTRIMRTRQAHVVYLQIMKAMKSLAQNHVGWNTRDEKTAKVMRDQIKEMYSQIDSFWKKPEQKKEEKTL